MLLEPESRLCHSVLDALCIIGESSLKYHIRGRNTVSVISERLSEDPWTLMIKMFVRQLNEVSCRTAGVLKPSRQERCSLVSFGYFSTLISSCHGVCLVH